MLIRGAELANREGQPYKLVLAVWQDDPATGGAVWVGKIERSNDSPRPEIGNPFGTDPIPFEMEAHMKELSDAFVRDLLS